MSNTYTPDYWIVIQISNEHENFYKLFGYWTEEYLLGDSWRFNSGITEVTKSKSGMLRFHGHSRSTYVVDNERYGLSPKGSAIIEHYIDEAKKIGTTIEILEDQDWVSFNWGSL